MYNVNKDGSMTNNNIHLDLDMIMAISVSGQWKDGVDVEVLLKHTPNVITIQNLSSSNYESLIQATYDAHK